ncbi:hypothetical protein EAG_11160 [Camponotus floridanus]|uniref:Uncharacterized protein n=1 Tax=Camponotus floridanus TaxID=104421 RepID=E2A865_CAMFO|nr:hypothetical protein EAG_11160 [Camponotus floridanus]
MAELHQRKSLANPGRVQFVHRAAILAQAAEYGTAEAIPRETADFDNRGSYFERSQCRSGIKVPMAILNCLYARQLCYEDSSCSAILEIIPRVCGPELAPNKPSIDCCQENEIINLVIDRPKQVVYVYTIYIGRLSYVPLVRHEKPAILKNLPVSWENFSQNVARINPKRALGNGGRLAVCIRQDCAERSFAGRIVGNPRADYHPFHWFCQGSRLAAAGCQAHSSERVQRRVWTTQEISLYEISAIFRGKQKVGELV